MRTPLLFLLLVAVAWITPAASLHAATVPADDPSGAPVELAVPTEDAAVERAREDERTRQLLALRPGLEPEVGVKEATETTPAAWVIRWEQGSRTRVVSSVDPLTGRVQSDGQALVVMPGTRAEAIVDLARPWLWLPLLAGFVVCVWLAPGGTRSRLLLTPLLAISVVFIVMVVDVVPADSIRAGNLVLLGAIVASLLALAALLVHAARRTPLDPGNAVPGDTVPGDADRVTPASRPAVVAGIVVAVVSIGMLVAGTVTARETIDVAVASTIGASLMGDGIPVYGNVSDIPGIIEFGDTYGPISYLPYVPAVKVTDRPWDVVLPTNVALALIVAALLFVIGRRRSVAVGIWAAAAWLSCPLVALGLVLGNNDVTVALPIVILLLLLHNPAGRGALVAVAAATKFLPLALLALVLRVRGESWHATRLAAAGFLAATVAIWAIALRGTTAAGAFWDRVVLGQADRDDIVSFWGLAGIGPVRYVLVGAALLLALWSARLVWQRGAAVIAPCGGAVLALLIAALPLTWPTYATWIVPLVLVTAIGPVATISAGRRAAALPSSTAP